MEDDKKRVKEQDFIVETPVIIEEKLGKGEKIRKYERGKFLGKGGFAKCYEMKCVETKRIYAAKVFEKKALTNARSRKKLINEIKLHKKLHHSNIVNFEHFFEDKDNVYILLELCSNQTLNEILKRRKRLTEIEVQCYLIQIIKALKYIHGHKIIHRDLKLGNCFITGKLELKLGDFGLAARLEYEGQRRRTVCGTPNYIAPEILEKKNGHSFEVDVWSLGVVAYTLLFGRPPFETADVKLTYKRINMNNYSFPENIKVHPSAKKLISSILNLDPSKRPSLDSILEHEFFRIYSSVPVTLPLSTLACPPSSKYTVQFMKNEKGFHTQSNSVNFNNTFTNLNIKYTANALNLDGLNNNINSGENLNISNDVINKLLSKNMNHRRSESVSNVADENVIEKVNQILQNVNNVSNSLIGSRNLNKNEINGINTEDKILVSENNQNIINNNYYINVGNLNNMELKLDESVLKKLEDVQLSNSIGNFNIINNILNNPQIVKKTSIFNNKITKYLDSTNKFGIVYYLNDSHLGIFFNDNSNLLKNMNFDKNQNNYTKFEYIYVDTDGKNISNFDESGFNAYLTNKDKNKDLAKKLEIFRHILNKQKDEFSNFVATLKKDFNPKIFYIKKFLKVQHAIMFRLSNKLIQVCFFDKTELIMSTETSDFFYLSKSGEEIQDTIQNVMNSENSELIKRIKYTKNLLIHFVKNQKSKKVPK